MAASLDLMILEHSRRETAPRVSMMYVEMLRPDPDQRNGHRLAKLYREHATAAFGYAHHLAGNREDAEDLVQLAFLEAHRALGRGERIVNPRAWLITAVKHRAYNLHRDRREAPDADAIAELADRSGDSTAEAAVELERVRAVLYGLPEAQHHAFVLRHWSGMSHRDIAGVLGCSESAVESLLVRARQAIVSDDTLSDACLDVRRRLSHGERVGRFHHRHLDSCRSCRTAQQRLARIAGIAAAVALIPRMHVAQALAASAPGFSVAAASGATGAAGTAAAGAAAKLGAAKTVLAVLSVGAIAAGAGVAHSHLLISHHGDPNRRQASLLPATANGSSPSVGERASSPNAESAPAAGNGAGRGDSRHGLDATSTSDKSGSDGSGNGDGASNTDQSSSTDTSPTGGNSSGDGSTSTDPSAQQGQDGTGSGGDTTPQPENSPGDQSSG